MGFFDWFIESPPSFASLNDVNRMNAGGDVKGLIKIFRDYNQLQRNGTISFPDDSDPRFSTVKAAGKALKEIGKPAVEPLIKALDVTVVQKVSQYNGKKFNTTDGTGYLEGGPDNDMCCFGFAQATSTLGKIGDERAVDILSKIFFINDDTQGLDIGGELGSIGGKRVVELLVNTINGNVPEWVFCDESMLEVAAYGLGFTGTNDIQAITSLLKLERDGLIGPTVTEALGKLPPEGVGDAYAKLGLHKEANEWYTSHGLLEKASATRRKEAEQGAVKVDQTVVHGDQVTKTEIKDSVLNRSNVGGGSSKMQELEKLTEMKKEGLIDDDEFKQMKKEILGK
jgi:hypothetical protein